MDSKRFREILEAYGADPRRWPVAERREVAARLHEGDEARRLFERESQLDALLDKAARHEPGPGLRAAVLAGARNAVQPLWKRLLGLPPDLFVPPMARRLAAATLAASFLCGAALGVMQPFAADPVSTVDSWSGALMTQIYLGY